MYVIGATSSLPSNVFGVITPVRVAVLLGARRYPPKRQGEGTRQDLFFAFLPAAFDKNAFHIHL